MAQYKFSQDYKATGTNIVPAGQMQPNVRLYKSFRKGDVVEGVIVPGNSGINPKGGGTAGSNMVFVKAQGVDQAGVPVNAMAQFNIPLSVLAFDKEQPSPKTSPKNDAAISKSLFDTSGISTQQKVGGVLGLAGGLYYAYRTGKGVWGYLGYAILFSIIGQFGGAAIAKMGSSKTIPPSAPEETNGTPAFEDAYLKMKNIAIASGAPVPEKPVVLSRYNSFSEIEKTAFSEYTNAIALLDARDTPTFISGKAAEFNAIKTKYGETVATKISQ